MGGPRNPHLSWFALTWGDFWVDLEGVELFRYAPATLAAWGVTKPYADYQIASFVRDLRSCLAPALAPLPFEIERLAADVDGLAALQSSTRRAADAMGAADTSGLYYAAWRWLGERSPCMAYLVQYPRFHFVRIGDEIEIGYDNRGGMIDGVAISALNAMDAMGMWPTPRDPISERAVQQVRRRWAQVQRRAKQTWTR